MLSEKFQKIDEFLNLPGSGPSFPNPAFFVFLFTVPDTQPYQSSHKLASKTRSNRSRDIIKGAGNYVNPARASEFKGRVQYSRRIQPDSQRLFD